MWVTNTVGRYLWLFIRTILFAVLGLFGAAFMLIFGTPKAPSSDDSFEDESNSGM